MRLTGYDEVVMSLSTVIGKFLLVVIIIMVCVSASADLVTLGEAMITVAILMVASDLLDLSDTIKRLNK